MIFWYCFRVHEDTDKCMSKSIDFEQISDCTASTTTLAPIQSTVPKRKYAMVLIFFGLHIYNIIWIYEVSKILS